MADRDSLRNMNYRFSLKSRKYLSFCTGLVLSVLVIYLLESLGITRDIVEIYTSVIISYVVFFTAYILARDFRFYLASAGLFLLSLAYFWDGAEELVFFNENGFIDRVEDMVSDYLVLASVLIICFGFIRMLTRKENSLNCLKQTSLMDPLTGVYNRRALFQIYGDKEIIDPVTFCYIDLDGFKEINDRNGHETGDVVLKDFAEIVTRLKRASDQFFRIGGDEFVL